MRNCEHFSRQKAMYCHTNKTIATNIRPLRLASGCTCLRVTRSGQRVPPLVAHAVVAGVVSEAIGAQGLAIPRGETAGAAVVLDGVTIQAGDRDLLTDVSLRIMMGQRVGLVGANGCGKSTLLKTLCGLRGADAGRVVVAPRVEVGYLEQTAVSGSTRTVWEEAKSRMTALVEAEAALARAERALEEEDPNAVEMLVEAEEQFELAGGRDAEKRITNVLTGLGFRPDQFHKRCDEFSGGWQMRISLARLLLGPAGQTATSGGTDGLLLLDEPTNHLDRAATSWLGRFLSSSSGGLVLVSHDADLLELACDHIVEVRGRTLHLYVGGYQKFLQEREAREQQLRATAEKQQEEIARLEGFINRFGAKATKASQAQSRAKQLEKLREEAVEVTGAPSGHGPGDNKKLTLKFPPAPPSYTDVITMKDVSIGWSPKDQGGSPLLGGVNFVIKKGQRVLVVGPNGAGKSTLLKTIAAAAGKSTEGDLLWSGERMLGQGVQLGVFNQDLAQDLPLDQPALDYVLEKAREYDPLITMEQGRQALGALGLVGSMALLRIGAMSGGEKARVALAVFALVPCNVMLLDEASNHLDAKTIQVLTGALQEFRGAIIAITHNPTFAASLNPTHILRVQDGRVKFGDSLRLTAADFDHEAHSQTPVKATQTSKAQSNSKSRPESAQSKSNGTSGTRPSLPSSSSTSSPGGTAPIKGPSTAKRRLGFYEQQEYKKLTKEIEKLSARRDLLNEELMRMADTGGDITAISSELGKLVEELEAKEDKWMVMAEIMGDI